MESGWVIQVDNRISRQPVDFETNTSLQSVTWKSFQIQKSTTSLEVCRLFKHTEEQDSLLILTSFEEAPCLQAYYASKEKTFQGKVFRCGVITRVLYG